MGLLYCSQDLVLVIHDVSVNGVTSPWQPDESTGNVREVPNGQLKYYGQAGRKKALQRPGSHRNVLKQMSMCELS